MSEISISLFSNETTRLKVWCIYCTSIVISNLSRVQRLSQTLSWRPSPFKNPGPTPPCDWKYELTIAMLSSMHLLFILSCDLNELYFHQTLRKLQFYFLFIKPKDKTTNGMKHFFYYVQRYVSMSGHRFCI